MSADGPAEDGTLGQLPQQDHYPDSPREEIAPFIPAARCVLDVGCGRGGFGLTLRRVLGPEARLVAVEPVAAQAGAARVDHGFDEVIHGYFPEALATRSERFDAVFFNDVLEHVHDPWRMLEQTRSFLNPSGKVVASIPSIQYAPVLVQLLRGRWDYADAGTLDRTHVRFFTRDTMVEMFEGAGLRVEVCQGINSAWEEWHERTLKRRALLRLLPQAEWLQYVLVGTAA